VHEVVVTTDVGAGVAVLRTEDETPGLAAAVARGGDVRPGWAPVVVPPPVVPTTVTGHVGAGCTLVWVWAVAGGAVTAPLPLPVTDGGAGVLAGLAGVRDEDDEAGVGAARAGLWVSGAEATAPDGETSIPTWRRT
jgi:hypothetical protein